MVLNSEHLGSSDTLTTQYVWKNENGAVHMEGKCDHVWIQEDSVDI